MSVQALNWVLGSRRRSDTPPLRGVKGSARLVLIALANYADDEGRSWPGLDTIADVANVTKDTAKDALTWLIEHGYIEREVRGAPLYRNESAQYRRNLYRILWDVEAEGGGITPSAATSEGVKHTNQRGRNTPGRGGETHPASADAPISLETGKEALFETRTAERCAELGINPEHVLLTPEQVAQQIMTGYWKWVKDRTGRNPVSIHPAQFKKLIVPFLAAGVTPDRIKRAVAALYEQGAPLTRQSIEREIDGRAPRTSKAAAASTVAKLREAQFDAAGNLVD